MKFLGISESAMLEEFLKREQFWLKSWTLLDADESYIRSASIRVIGLAYESRNLKDSLLSKLSLVGKIIYGRRVLLKANLVI